MGKRVISYLIILLLITSGLTFFTSSLALELDNENKCSNSRAIDYDNSFDTATYLSNNTLYSDSVDMDDDMFDFYTIYLQANSTAGELFTINITLDSYIYGIQIYVYNPEKYIIVYEYYSLYEGDEFNRSICACTPGFYYFVIGADWYSEVDYNFIIYNQTVNRTIDNDNANATANNTAGSGSYVGVVNATYDYLDLYNISITCGISTTEGLTIYLSVYNDLYLAVYSPDGTLREMTTSGIIEFAADQTGTYRMAVGIYNEIEFNKTYYLNITVTPDVPVDDDYDKEHAVLVYDGTMLDSSFDSQFDIADWYMIDLDYYDELLVSLIYTAGTGYTDIDIYDEDGNWMNNDYETDYYKGCWAITQVYNSGRCYIEVENWWNSQQIDYTILFSLQGETLWYEPMIKNDTNLDFSMDEDTVDNSHVNLYDIFYKPDNKPLTFNSPSHLSGKDTNFDITILYNGSVRFEPHQDFYGTEDFNFSARDERNNYLYWELKVTVLTVNDAPIITNIGDQIWKEDKEVNISITVTDVDDSEFIFSDNTTLFDVNPETNNSIRFTPTNDQVGIYYINITVYDIKNESTTVYPFIHFKADIRNTNDPPRFEKVGGKDPVSGFVIFTAKEDTWYNFSVEAYDIDHEAGAMDVLSFYSNVSDPTFLVDRKTGDISFLPQQTHVGEFFVQIAVEDGNGGSAYQNISITVLNTNDNPEPPFITPANTNYLTVNYSVGKVVDEDGDTLTYTWDFGDGSPTTTGLYGNHTYTKSGNYTITVTVSDGNLGISKKIYNVSVNAPPKSPAITSEEKTSDFFSDNSMFLLIIIIIIIVVILAVAAVVIYKKKRQRAELEAMPEPQVQVQIEAPPPEAVPEIEEQTITEYPPQPPAYDYEPTPEPATPEYPPQPPLYDQGPAPVPPPPLEREYPPRPPTYEEQYPPQDYAYEQPLPPPPPTPLEPEYPPQPPAYEPQYPPQTYAQPPPVYPPQQPSVYDHPYQYPPPQPPMAPPLAPNFAYCPQCNSQIQVGTLICPVCGITLTW